MACHTSSPPPKVFQLSGQAQGTTYAITYYGSHASDYQTKIDSILFIIPAVQVYGIRRPQSRRRMDTSVVLQMNEIVVAG